MNAAVTESPVQKKKITLERTPDSNALGVVYDIMQPHAYAWSVRGEREMMENVFKWRLMAKKKKQPRSEGVRGGTRQLHSFTFEEER